MLNKIKRIFTSSVVFLIVFPAYIAAYVAVYFSIVNFFSPSMHWEKNILLWSLVFLGLFLGSSIMISTLLAHWWDNLFNRKYYFFSGMWVGFVINLLLFFGLGWGFVWLSELFGSVPNKKLVGFLAIIGAAIYSLYGIINAFTPIVKRINVAIRNLPETWIGKKIVHISDVHLGHIYHCHYMCEIAKKINSLRPEAIVITGDLFDGTDGELEAFVEPLKMLQAKSGVFYASGNHETYLGVGKTFETLGKTKITTLRNEVRDVGGLQFVGIEYPGHSEKRNVAKTIKSMSDFDHLKPSVLLWHIPTQIRKIRKLGISLMLCGHTHKGQLFPFGLLTHFMFGGYDYGLKQKGDFSIYISSGLGAWGTPMRTEKHSEIVEITLQKK